MISPLGNYRDRVVILKRSASSDTQGGRTVTWVDLVKESASLFTRFAASVLPANASEQMQASNNVGAEQTYRVEMRYRADITPLMRCVWRPFKATADKTLEVRTVMPKDNQRDAIWLLCSEVL